MGGCWRRFSEKFKEKAGRDNFAITSNKRNTAMMNELAPCSAQLKQFERDLRSLKHVAEIALKTTKETMVAPLPRVYDDDKATTPGSKVQQPTKSIAEGLPAETLSSLSLDAGQKLNEDVFTPIGRWQSTYLALTVRNKELEKLRLEMDSRKRTVDELSVKVDDLRGKADGNSKVQARADSATLKLQRKQAKFSVAQERYRYEEEELYNKLKSLAHDAIWIRSYASVALKVEGGMLFQAGETVGTVDPELAAAAAANAAATTAALSASQTRTLRAAVSAFSAVGSQKGVARPGVEVERLPTPRTPAQGAALSSVDSPYTPRVAGEVDQHDGAVEGSATTSEPAALPVAFGSSALVSAVHPASDTIPEEIPTTPSATMPPASVSTGTYTMSSEEERSIVAPATPGAAPLGAAASGGAAYGGQAGKPTGALPAQNGSPTTTVVFHRVEDLEEAPEHLKHVYGKAQNASLAYHDADLDQAPAPPKHVPTAEYQGTVDEDEHKLAATALPAY